ncbi:MAG: hypothetical protein GC171_06705 [Terrimonas sp.]|nr:hypothetical protein [Terrimonas sp.]
MNTASEKIIQTLFDKSSLSACSVEEIKAFTATYPFFSGAQLLLAKKLQTISDPEFEEQLNTVSLFVNNPLLLNYYLDNQEYRLVHNETLVAEASVDEPGFSDPAVEQHGIEDPGVPDAAAADDAENETGPGHADDENIGIRNLLQKEVQSSEKMEEILFGPFHTVDYFESQGIKTKTEELIPDRFSTQLRSFTEWLKTLKTIPPDKIPELADNSGEEKVTALAGASLQEKDIVTEAMAAVWLKQGNHEKAREIYSKLSLLNPAKSAYFASLIEKIKD